MAYLYRHIRLDNGMPFYIGIGGLKRDDNYNRAYRKSNKLQRWKKIVNAVGYRVDIVIDNLSIEEAKAKEIEFINLYGRKDKKTGFLVNMTNGGDATFGYTHTEESKRQMSITRIGRKTSDKQKKAVGSLFKNKFGIMHNRSIRVRCIETGQLFGSQSEAQRVLNLGGGSVSWSIKHNKPVYGMHFEIGV